MTSTTLLVALMSAIAPLIYCIPGLAVLLTLRESHRLWLAPLLGYLLVGWLAEWSLVFQIPAAAIVWAGIGLSAVLVWRRREGLAGSESLGKYFYLVYLVALAAILLNPYPGEGHWSGDWLENFNMGEAIRKGSYPLEFVQRSPIFAGAATPLHLFLTGLAPYQIASAVAAAAAAMALPYAYRALGAAQVPWTWIFAWLLSPLFLLHIVTIWPKWLAGGCLLLCAVDLMRYRRRDSVTDMIWASAWFAASVAAHISSIILIPILACLAWYRTPVSWRAIARDLGLLLFFGLLIPGLFDGWSIAKFGLKERLAHNPTVLYRLEGQDLTLVALGSTFFGSNVIPLIQQTWANPQLGSGLLRILATGFFTVSFWVHLMAGTFTAILVPVYFAARGKVGAGLASLRQSTLFWPVLVASLVALVIHGTLVVQIPYAGATQIGLTGLCLMLICLLGFIFHGKENEPVARRLLVINFVFGAIPFILMQGILLTALQLPARISDPLLAMLFKEDEDVRIVRELGLTPVGEQLFPLALVAAAFLGWLCFRYLRRTEVSGAGRGSTAESLGRTA